MENDIRIKIGSRIKNIRESKNMTQQQLAELADLQQKTISKIENGLFNVSIDTLDKITTALNASIIIEPTE